MTEWQAFAQLEPFGGEHDYLGYAIVAMVVANANRGKGSSPYKVEDFIPKFRDKPQGVDQMLQYAEMMTAALGGEDRRNG